MTEWGAVVAAAGAIGVAVAAVLLLVRLASPPAALVRINVHGKEVPAVLGDSVIGGSLAGLAVLAIAAAVGHGGGSSARVGAAVALLVVALGAAGRLDDLRGDETERGFRGHLDAARSGRITGGFIKIAAGVAGGLAAGAIVTRDPLDAILTGAVVALAANLFNLFDRAPGRAAKLWFVAMVPVVAVGTDAWIAASAGMIGAALTVFPADLGARAMLGDAGVNPLGAVWGLGLALALETGGRVVAAVVLLVLNLVSERVSFSEVIDRTAPLRAFDRLGRK
jgi:UDP-GlcNAc:undecaprenyl-phosphate GlcNAc-1-phosphate transferase